MSKKLKQLQSGISATMDKAISKDDADALKSKENFDFNMRLIDIDKIKVNERNFYKIEEIEELAEDIRENGLAHNLVVNKIDENNYKLISGERRYTAIKSLNEQGYQGFNKIPCKIINKNEVDAQIRLIQINALTRNLSEYEKMVQVEQLKVLYEAKKQNGEKIKGRVEDKISEILSISKSQVNRLNAISKGIDPLKEALKNKEIGQYEASQVARLSSKGQEVAIDIIKNTEDKIDIDELKKDIQSVEEEPIPQKVFEKKLEDIKKTYKNKQAKKEQNVQITILKNIKTMANKLDKITCDVSCLDDEVAEEILQAFEKLESSFFGLKEELELISNNN